MVATRYPSPSRRPIASRSLGSMKYAVRESRGWRRGSLSWRSSWMLRHRISSRSGAGTSRTISTPQHSAGYSATACAEGKPATREGGPAAREGGNDRDLVPVLQRGVEPLQGLDRLVVHVDVHVVVHLALIVPHEPLQRAELVLQLVEQTFHVRRLDRHAVGVL